MKIKILLWIIAILIISSGYANAIKISNSKDPETNVETHNIDQWTVMIYLDGDNNLEDAMEASMDLLEGNGYTEEVNVLVQYDSESLFDGLKRYEITESGAELRETLSERSMGDKETLVDFVRWAEGDNKAAKYCLVLSDHGVGWRNGFLQDVTDKQNNKPDYLSIFELKDAMNEIRQIVGDKIDLLVFDACQMAIIEVYYQIRNSVKLCVGTSDMTYGCPFDRVISDINEDSDCDAVTLAEYFVNSYHVEYSSRFKFESYDIEFLYDTLKDKLDEFSIALINNFNDYEDEIMNAIDDTTSYNGENGYITHYKSLDIFAMRIRNSISDTSIQEKAQNLIDALWDCKLYATGYPALSIYLPTKNRNYPYDPTYADLDLCLNSDWYDFIEIIRQIKSKNRVINPIINSIIIDFIQSLKLT
jgi:hypothetical protein